MRNLLLGCLLLVPQLHASGLRGARRPLFTQAARDFSLAPAPELSRAAGALQAAGIPAYIAPETYPEARWHLYLPRAQYFESRRTLADEGIVLRADDLRAAAPRHQPEALVQLLEAVSKAADKKPYVLFDIDDTVAATAGRHRRIIREFLARDDIKAAYPEYSAKLAAYVAANEPMFNIRDTAMAAGVEGDHFIAELVEFWKPRFFSNEYLGDDEPIAGAAEYLAALRARGARIVYLTGRSEPLRPGTAAALEKLGLPVPDGKDVVLVLKQDKSERDHVYKDRVLAEIVGWGPVLGGFENEPQNANVFKKHFPEALIIFLDTRHSNPRDPHTGEPVEVDARIPWVRDYTLPPSQE